MRKILIIGAFLIFFIPVKGIADDSLDVGSFSFGGKLQLDGWAHQLGDGWSVTKVAGGLNNNYSYNPSTATSNAMSTVFGETLFLDFGFHPSKHITGEINLELIGNYADKYWMPVNLEHRMDLDGDMINWNRGEITYDAKWGFLKYFRNVGHYNWSDKGDLFNLYPAHYDTDTYLRVSGRSVPEGYELFLEGKAGKLELIYAPEALWDYKSGYYANYGFSLFGLNSNLMYRNHIIPYGQNDERMETSEFSTDIDFSLNSLQLAVLYQPFRLNTPYNYVNEVPEGQGYLGSRFDEKTGTTNQSDALGYSTKLSLRSMPVISEMTFQLTQLGLVAGNKQEFDAKLTKRMADSLTGSFEYMYRKPLLGPMPLATEGTLSNPGPALLEPRDMSSPFWVGWGNQDWDNREANQMSVIFTYDPTPGTWFYMYEPDKPEEWNLNPKENAPFSCAFKYTLSRYFTGTDRLLYWDESGNMIWEGSGLTEPWATNGYIGNYTLMPRIQTENSVTIFNIGGGESLAVNGFAYTDSAGQGKSITSYFIAGVSYERKPYLVKLRYNHDYWGPEYWHQCYGETFDDLYMLSITRSFGEYVKAGIEYIGARQTELKYAAPELGDFDEFHVFFSIAFGPIISYSRAAQEKEFKNKPPTAVNRPPQVSLTLPSDVFLEAEGQTLVVQEWATDVSGIASWKLYIKNAKGNIVKTLTGNGQPPYSVKWNGKDDIYGVFVPAGKYYMTLEAQNNAGLLAQSKPQAVTVMVPANCAPERPAQEAEVKVDKIDRGFKISLSGKVLFDTAQSVLKPEAIQSLDKVVTIISNYKQNKISVEGHTDSVGDDDYNEKLSKKRAVSVAMYLIKAGVSESRITVEGYGKSRPAASNETESGREANRRVEVIILNK